MIGTIINGVIIQAPHNITQEAINTILQQSLEEFKVMHKTLGGIDLELDADTLYVRTWERSPTKYMRAIANFTDLIPEPVAHTPEESSVVSETENPEVDLFQDNTGPELPTGGFIAMDFTPAQIESPGYVIPMTMYQKLQSLINNALRK